ncbi:hypothetical protein AB8A05_03980 [Tardiphaga sp. 538_B7_N1_4]|uniref:hypothetical protein n=1 Tax=Tardiphaga sp. 538_B7_N1_4 TaxID=3240778 RepID=UPI003F28DD7E
MSYQITNGSTVNRVWVDGCELMAVFQYEGDAIAFATAKVFEDEKAKFSSCDYAVNCAYSGKMTMIRRSLALASHVLVPESDAQSQETREVQS